MRRKEKVQLPEIAPGKYFCADSYIPPEYLDRFERDFPHECQAFLNKGNPDPNNKTYMDSRIEKIIDEVIKGYREDRIKHIKQIHNLADVNNSTQKRILVALEANKQKEEYEKQMAEFYENLLYKGTSLSHAE